MAFKVGDKVRPSDLYKKKFQEDDCSAYVDMEVKSIDNSVWPIETVSQYKGYEIEALWYEYELELVTE